MTTSVERIAARRSTAGIRIRKAQVVCSAVVSAVGGAYSAKSGAITEVPYSLATRFGAGKGNSPKELLAAAHAGCFIRTLAFSRQVAGYAPTELSTEATVTRELDGPGDRISRSALMLKALRTQIRLDAKLL